MLARSLFLNSQNLRPLPPEQERIVLQLIGTFTQIKPSFDVTFPPLSLLRPAAGPTRYSNIQAAVLFVLTADRTGKFINKRIIAARIGKKSASSLQSVINTMNRKRRRARLPPIETRSGPGGGYRIAKNSNENPHR